jgi:O-acetyl-ADP-ribose deacetylase (regulator of RNase III)
VDIVLLNASVFALPAAQRADAIVYDGTADLGLWRPPGPDRDLLAAYGDALPAALAKERGQLPGGKLGLGQALRLHPGKLRCDYVIWVATRGAHGAMQAAAAPGLAELEQVAVRALELASKHDTVRVAFAAAGAGPGAADASERMAALVRGASAFRTRELAQGRSLVVEEVFVCTPSAADVAKARRLTAQLAREAKVAQPPAPKTSPEPRQARQARKPRSPARSSNPPRGRRNRLDADELARARAYAQPYDRTHVYQTGEWFVHPSFGLAKVASVLGPERMVTALCEDGEERRLIHGR